MSALAFRLERQHLNRRVADAATAAVAGLQDTPPGTAALSLAARADVAPEALDDLVVTYSIRGAPLAVAPADLPLFTAGLDPPDERAARTFTRKAWKSVDMPVLEALDRVTEAVGDSLRAGPLPRDDFHQALRERLPESMLPWCDVCGSHHVHSSLWRATGARGVLAVVGREGRSAVFGLPPKVKAVKDPGAALARRFLSLYGPARPTLLAGWAGIATSHAKALWARAGALAEVDGGSVLATDLEAYHGAPEPAGVRLLPNLDPLNVALNRELLAPEAAVRKRIWTSLGGAGTIMADGRLAGTWRPKKQGKKLVVLVDTDLPTDALEAEATRMAPFRGAESAEVRR